MIAKYCGLYEDNLNCVNVISVTIWFLLVCVGVKISARLKNEICNNEPDTYLMDWLHA